MIVYSCDKFLVEIIVIANNLCRIHQRLVAMHIKLKKNSIAHRKDYVQCHRKPSLL